MYGVHATGRYLILMLERADGNLADLHAAYREQTGSNVPAEHALELLEQAALALDFMGTTRHPGLPSSHGLQHCDVKPSNLLLFGDTLKVADFGLCAGSGWHTHKSGWKGTRPYAAPELFNGAAAPGTDQYALAVTFCELVMGERVFVPGASATGMPIDLTRVRERDFPIISRALHPYPSSRWPSCVEFLHALRQATIEPRPGRSPRASSAAIRAVARRRSGVIRTVRDVLPPARVRL
jgi:serine/threonine-protein kinase